MFAISHKIDLSFVGLVDKSNDLPSITASLFLSPGGRKFLDFMNAFVRYVAKHCWIKVGQIKWKFSTWWGINAGNDGSDYDYGS